jgi:hypothetical protein
MLADPKYKGYFDGGLKNVYLQSFDQAVVQYLKGITSLPVVFLTPCPATPEAAQAIAAYADGIGISRTASASSAECVARAHAAGLLVHVYTLLSDPAAHLQVHGWGVDGIFGNHPDVTKSVRDTVYPLVTMGFHSPVRHTTPAAAGQPTPLADASKRWQLITGGSTVPLKFNVFSASTGSELVTLLGAIETVSVYAIPRCSGAGNGEKLPYQDLAREDGRLRYDLVAGHFILNWKTPRTGGESCYRATLTARDGTSLHTFIKAWK